MLKLSTSYSKKIPVDGQDFSSQQFHASVELELSDSLEPDAIKSRIHDTFSMVKAAVEDELNGRASDGTYQPPKNSKQGRGDSNAKASNAQIKYLVDILSQRGLDISSFNCDIAERFGASGLYDLTRSQASTLLDELNGKRKAA